MCLSGRTVGYRAKILKDEGFLSAFTNDYVSLDFSVYYLLLRAVSDSGFLAMSTSAWNTLVWETSERHSTNSEILCNSGVGNIYLIQVMIHLSPVGYIRKVGP